MNDKLAEMLASRLAASRSFADVCRALVHTPIFDQIITGALIARIDEDAHIRESGRYGISGPSPSEIPVSLWDTGLISRSTMMGEPQFYNNLKEMASHKQLTPRGDIDQIALQNEFQSLLVIPLVESGFIYGVLGLLSPDPMPEEPKNLIGFNLMQSLLSLSVRSLGQKVATLYQEGAQDYDLSNRELKVLRLIAEGQTNQEIALAMNLSVPSIKLAVGSILKKLMVANRKLAIAKARASGLLTQTTDFAR